MPIFATKGAIVNSINSKVSEPNVTKIVYDVDIFILSFEIIIAILQSLSEWQLDKVDWSVKNADFSTSMVAMATSLKISEKDGRIDHFAIQYLQYGAKIVKADAEILRLRANKIGCHGNVS